MTRTVLLDAAPLSLVTHPAARDKPEALRCNEWLRSLLEHDCRVIIPEIADYELRRELLRAGKTKSLARLDALEQLLEYAPVTTAALRLAAALWAEARRVHHRQTADDQALDGDMILCAQARLAGGEAIIATSNPGHLSLFADAREWERISPRAAGEAEART